MVLVSSVPKLPLFLPAWQPFSFKESDVLIKYPSYWWEVSPFFFVNDVCFICPKLPLFSRPATLFLQGHIFLNSLSILWMWSLSILFCQCSYPVILKKILTELQVHHSSFSFLLRWIQFKLSVLIISLSSCQMLSHAGAPLNHSLLAIHLSWSVEDISEDSSFLPRSVQAIWRLLSHSSHLIQPVQSPLSINCSTVFLLSGP